MPIEMREMTLFASAFAMPMNICARLFLFDKPIKCFAFLFTFCFYVYFSRSYESRLSLDTSCMVINLLDIPTCTAVEMTKTNSVHCRKTFGCLFKCDFF